MIKEVIYASLGPIWYHSEPSDVPYSPNQFLGWDLFCRFIQQDSSSTSPQKVWSANSFGLDNSKITVCTKLSIHTVILVIILPRDLAPLFKRPNLEKDPLLTYLLHVIFSLDVSTNISSIVEFQKWWVLKSKIFGQEST